MKLTFPNIYQAEFDYAFDCLNDCMQPEAEAYGFRHPYFTPGGAYGKQWWQLDSALALCGYKWKDRKFAETALLNFIESQKEDGRICLWGNDLLPQKVAGDNFPEQGTGVSSLPKIFDAAYHIVTASADKALLEKTYRMLKRYLDWWYTARYDAETGLISSVFEETFIPYLGKAMEYAGVDTNVEVYVGLVYTAELAERLGENADALRCKAEQLKKAINTHLWDTEKGAYYPFDLQKKVRIHQLMASTFFPLRMQIAPAEHKAQLLALLKNHDKFNWETIPLTSVAKDDPIFQTTEGHYQGNASWSGNVWTLINEMVVRGLLDSEESELAAELALKTIYTFNNNCAEFANPFDGNGHGVLKYAWTASQYLELLIEVIFGVRSDAIKNEVCIAPNLCKTLRNRTLSIANLMVFDGVSLDISIANGDISYRISDNRINVKVL